MDSRVEQLLSRARSLAAKFQKGNEIRYIDEAIMLGHEAVDICTPGHAERPACLIALSHDIWTRYIQLGGMRNLNEAVVLGQEAVALCSPDHLHRSLSLNNLACLLWGRYNQFGGVEDINEMINLGQAALALRPPGHPDRSGSLNNLAIYLSTRYQQLGGLDDLNEAIRLDRDALALRPPGHPNRPMTLRNLAIDLHTRYEQLGAVNDLNEAIDLDREALTLCPPGHPDRSTSLNNLATLLSSRYKLLGGVDDLNEAICLHQDAVALRPPGHPLRSSTLNNLAIDLHTRYDQLGAVDDLNEAIRLDREALTLRPPGHPDRSSTLNNLAAHLWTRYNKHDGVEDLNDVIDLSQEALSLRPPGDPARSGCLFNCAIYLYTRYKQHGAVDDLNEAIRLDRSALALRPPGHPDWSASLRDLTSHLSSRYNLLHDVEDQEEIFRLYNELACVAQTVSSSDLYAAKAWVNAAEEFHHPTTCLAYETALRLLVQHLAALPSLPQHLTVLKALSSSLAVDAFSACLRSQSLANAVELLEQGRGVFWSQLTRLRSPLDDLIASGPAGQALADEFRRLASLIRIALDSPSADQHDQVCRLNFELQKVVSKIRELPGHSRFLLPLLFSDLRRAASGGPVIILNTSKYSCDALVVSVDKDPVHIPLSITKEHVREISSKLGALTVRAKRSDVTKDLGIVMRELWNRVVSPIADFLRTTYPPQSRIWWCPTAEFSLLPLHAAGPYKKNQRNFSDLYISSYTPTLSALIRARQHHSSTSAMGPRRFLGVGQAKATGTSELLSVNTELASIGQRIDGLATFTRIEGEESCISRVTEELRKNQWVHLACHGFANRKEPLESAFALRDGHFTIQHIIRCELQDPQFAYLSACHTTVGDKESPDEVIHLASAMQFAGFRSVIGTMWAVDDAEANKITSVFYSHMMDESDRLDHTRAAYALWKTMRSLRSVNVPFDQRILYTHIGA